MISAYLYAAFWSAVIGAFLFAAVEDSFEYLGAFCLASSLIAGAGTYSAYQVNINAKRRYVIILAPTDTERDIEQSLKTLTGLKAQRLMSNVWTVLVNQNADGAIDWLLLSAILKDALSDEDGFLVCESKAGWGTRVNTIYYDQTSALTSDRY